MNKVARLRDVISEIEKYFPVSKTYHVRRSVTEGTVEERLGRAEAIIRRIHRIEKGQNNEQA